MKGEYIIEIFFKVFPWFLKNSKVNNFSKPIYFYTIGWDKNIDEFRKKNHIKSELIYDSNFLNQKANLEYRFNELNISWRFSFYLLDYLHNYKKINEKTKQNLFIYISNLISRFYFKNEERSKQWLTYFVRDILLSSNYKDKDTEIYWNDFTSLFNECNFQIKKWINYFNKYNPNFIYNYDVVYSKIQNINYILYNDDNLFSLNKEKLDKIQSLIK